MDVLNLVEPSWSRRSYFSSLKILRWRRYKFTSKSTSSRLRWFSFFTCASEFTHLSVSSLSSLSRSRVLVAEVWVQKPCNEDQRKNFEGHSLRNRSETWGHGSSHWFLLSFHIVILFTRVSLWSFLVEEIRVLLDQRWMLWTVCFFFFLVNKHYSLLLNRVAHICIRN